jgi:hypothetical protein
MIIEYSSLRDFAPYKRGEMIHPNLVVSHSSFDIYLYHLLKCAPNPKWLCHQSISHNMKLFFPNMVMAPIIPKNSCNSFKVWQCGWKHSNTHVITSFFFFFFFWVWKFSQMWIINMKRDYLIFLGGRKKSLYLQKNENHVATFPYWFWFGNNF